MDKKNKKKTAAIVLAVLFCGALYLYGFYRQEQGQVMTESFSDEQEKEPADDSLDTGSASAGSEEKTVYIHICGAVKNPGVYRFKKKPRVVEVIKKAGGFTKKAQKDSLNQAAVVEDGTQLVIPKKSGKKPAKTQQQMGAGKNTADSSDDGKININQASKEKLMELSGIGESKAAQIISYREENGAFQKIEDIMKISGIKEGVFGRIKDFITV